MNGHAGQLILGQRRKAVSHEFRSLSGPFWPRKPPTLPLSNWKPAAPPWRSPREGHGVTHGQIAKTLSLRVGDRNFVVVTRGDARLDNKKAKAAFGGKARMLSPEEVLAVTGHPVGGVSPFGLATALPVYCDVSLKAFDEVVPAAGSTNSALRINPIRMAELIGAEWVDVCQTETSTV